MVVAEKTVLDLEVRPSEAAVQTQSSPHENEPVVMGTEKTVTRMVVQNGLAVDSLITNASSDHDSTVDIELEESYRNQKTVNKIFEDHRRLLMEHQNTAVCKTSFQNALNDTLSTVSALKQQYEQCQTILSERDNEIALTKRKFEELSEKYSKIASEKANLKKQLYSSKAKAAWEKIFEEKNLELQKKESELECLQSANLR